MAERDLVAAIADQMGLGFWDPAVTPVSPMVESMIPLELARQYVAIAVALRGEKLVVAMEDPNDEEAVHAIGQATGWKVTGWLGARGDIVGMITAMYGPETAFATGVAADMPAQLHINQLLTKCVEERGSDLHLTAGLPPMVRVDGALRPLEGYAPLNPSQVRDLVYAVLSNKFRERFEEEQELDTSHVVPEVGRFRMNVFFQRDSVGTVLRFIPFDILSLEKLGIPRSVGQFADLPARPCTGDRPHWIGQIDDARGAHRRHQPDQAVAHHVGRGPDRVPPPPQDGGRQPERSRRGHKGVRRTPSSTCCARTQTSSSSEKCATSRRYQQR